MGPGSSLGVQWLRIRLPAKNRNLCRGNRFDPRSRGIPHAVEQLSLSATSTEPVCRNY